MLVFPEIMITHRENRALLGAFLCRRSFRDNFPRNYWAIKETCSLCLYDPSDLCKSHDIVSTMIKWIYITNIYIVHECLNDYPLPTVQLIIQIQLVEPKGGRHVGEADLPPSCCEADLRWWSLAGGLQCYDTSASDGAIGTWGRLGWTNDVFYLGVSCCDNDTKPFHMIHIYIYIIFCMMIAGEPNLV